jgi:hypothetical protein
MSLRQIVYRELPSTFLEHGQKKNPFFFLDGFWQKKPKKQKRFLAKNLLFCFKAVKKQSSQRHTH